MRLPEWDSQSLTCYKYLPSAVHDFFLHSYIEDFFSLGKFDEEETQILKKMVYVKSDPPTSIQYSTHLENAGFSQIQVMREWSKILQI